MHRGLANVPGQHGPYQLCDQPRRPANGIAVTTTWRLLQLAHRKKWIDADTLWGYVQTLRVNDRGTPPGVRDRAAFDKWLPT
jgi:hypothetical protein